MAILERLLIAFSLITSALSVGLQCSEHPAYSAGVKSVLAYSWRKLEGNRHTVMAYHPRYSTHSYAPIDEPSSEKYVGLDWFLANSDDDAAGSEAYVRLFLQRPVKAYLAIAPEYDETLPDGTLPGWEGEGWAEKEDDREDFVSGVHHKYRRYLPRQVYIFSKTAEKFIDIPENQWIKANVGGVQSDGHWYLMLAESNGDAPSKPRNPAGVEDEILPNEKCPDSLHDMWTTRNTDEDDEDTLGKKWRTWHPMWDPCYWCAYDHEHGSSAKHLMGYEPKYEYVSYKNDREVEDHEGFKGHVFKTENNLFVYWSIHVQTSSLRRIDVHMHTVTFVVVDADTKELLVEVNHKGDFGFRAVRAIGGFLALSPEDEERERELEEGGLKRNKRSFNVIDEDDLDPRFEYETPRENLMRGRYEDWTTGPLCAGSGHKGMITTDTTNPISGIKSFAQKDEKVQLGIKSGDGFIRNEGSSRIMIMTDFDFGEHNCNFNIADIENGVIKDGVFYTDPSGTKLVRGPSENSVHQYVKPGFSMNMEGTYVLEPIDAWMGLLVKDGERGSSSYGYGIDPEVN